MGVAFKAPIMRKIQNTIPQIRDPFQSLLGHLFRDTLTDLQAEQGRRESAPRTNIAETEAGYELSFELPGVDESDIDVQLHENVLTVSAHRAAASDSGDDEPGRRWHRLEHGHGESRRSISLPQDAADDGVEAVCKNGVLSVIVPKQERAQPSKIQVRAG